MGSESEPAKRKVSSPEESQNQLLSHLPVPFLKELTLLVIVAMRVRTTSTQTKEKIKKSQFHRRRKAFSFNAMRCHRKIEGNHDVEPPVDRTVKRTCALRISQSGVDCM